MTKDKKNARLEDLIPDAALRDRMVEHLYSQKPLLTEGSVFSELLQSMVDRMLEGEMDDFMQNKAAESKKNKRNGYTKKKLISNAGLLNIKTPRDRFSEFEPELVGKRERELSSGVDEQILALYAQGNSIEDVRRLLSRLYGLSVSAGKISAITDQVLPEIQEWRTRPLKAFYTILYLDAIHFKVRHDGKYSSRAFYTCYGIDADGKRDLLGIYINASEGANRWGMILRDIKNRGTEDVLVFCTDDLQGFSEAITDVFPQGVIQKCIVHKIRNSTRFCDDKDKREVCKALRSIYTSADREQALTALAAFEVKWDHKYADIAQSWHRDWDELMAFLDYPVEMRKIIYTTNPVEALHRIIRKLIKGKAAWVSETALIKHIYLSLMYNKKSWKRKVHGWNAIQRGLRDQYGERFTKHLKGS